MEGDISISKLLCRNGKYRQQKMSLNTYFNIYSSVLVSVVQYSVLFVQLHYLVIVEQFELPI